MKTLEEKRTEKKINKFQNDFTQKNEELKQFESQSMLHYMFAENMKIYGGSIGIIVRHTLMDEGFNITAEKEIDMMPTITKHIEAIFTLPDIQELMANIRNSDELSQVVYKLYKTHSPESEAAKILEKVRTKITAG